jgi:hypothetical protein
MRVVCADDAVAMWWGPNAQSATEIDIFRALELDGPARDGPVASVLSNIVRVVGSGKRRCSEQVADCRYRTMWNYVARSGWIDECFPGP